MTNLHNPALTNGRFPTREVADGLRHSLNNNFGRLIGAAGREWERRFAGTDPSDACVSVRISGGIRAGFPQFRTARQQFVPLAA
jgi:hypothetical protein